MCRPRHTCVAYMAGFSFTALILANVARILFSSRESSTISSHCRQPGLSTFATTAPSQLQATVAAASFLANIHPSIHRLNPARSFAISSAFIASVIAISRWALNFAFVLQWYSAEHRRLARQYFNMVRFAEWQCAHAHSGLCNRTRERVSSLAFSARP